MRNLIRRFIKVFFSSQFSKYPLISASKIERLDLISYQAIIRNSELRGNVTVREFSKIIDALIVGDVQIDRRTTFNGPNSDIFALLNTVRIGSYCSIARNVSIQEYNHIFNRITSYFVHMNVFGDAMENDIVSDGDIVIGNDVWIGTQSVILSGATISDGAVIGANSVVNSFIPPYAIAVGSPAKVVKYRFPEHLIDRLLNLKWWDWDDEKIKRNRNLFDGSLTEEKMDQVI